MSSELTILHASDLQCGRPYVPRAAEAFVRLAHRLQPDVVVIAGDLTQRAKAREFRAAVELMGRLPKVPTIVTPGNHDVPLYRAWERALAPYRNWRRFVAPDLDTVTRLDEATFVALNSSAPRRAIVGGRIDASQLDFARQAFAATAPQTTKVLVIHHHFVPTPDGTGGRPLPGARELVRAFASMRVDFVLGGHVHRTHVRTSSDVAPGSSEEIPLIACGTATSRRGRGPERGLNSLNVVAVRTREVEVRPHVLEEGASDFEPVDAIVLPRIRLAEMASGGGNP
jgi:3',5'-cyclic AMP phosphodiesterase CpdA